MREDQIRRDALDNLPRGWYLLTAADTLEASDLLWSWTSREWLRADSELWLYSSLTCGDLIEDLICAIRRVGNSEFVREVPVRRKYILR